MGICTSNPPADVVCAGLPAYYSSSDPSRIPPYLSLFARLPFVRFPASLHCTSLHNDCAGVSCLFFEARVKLMNSAVVVSNREYKPEIVQIVHYVL